MNIPLRLAIFTAVFVSMTNSTHAATTNFNKNSDVSPIYKKASDYNQSIVFDIPNLSNDKGPAQLIYAKGIDGVPLMGGLTPIAGKDVLFETKSGRIVETEANGSVEADAVYAFYQNALPPLGWKVVDGRTYERNQERLRISANINTDAITQVKFFVQPIAKN